MGPGRQVGAAALSLCLALASACNGVEQAPREIIVIARGMTFVLASDSDTPNPVIPMRAGERVRLVLKNEAPGLIHDIGIPTWKVQVEQIRAGESADVTFTVPSAVGRHQYLCRPHGELMKGFVEVTP